MAEPKKYVVRPGFTHGANEQYGPGDIVELTVQEYRGFEDKLAPIEEVDLVNPVQPTPSALKLSAAERKALAAAGLDTDEKITAASDEELLAIDGIGPKSVDKIRAGA